MGPSSSSKIFCWFVCLQLAFSKIIRNIPGLGLNEGITSILKLSWHGPTDSLVVGTKRGSLLILKQDELLRAKDPEEIQVHSIQAEENVEDPPSSPKTPFPIYSLARSTTPNGGVFFSGGGDRYVTVWGVQPTTSPQGRNKDWLWKTSSLQKLAPHTGWVKDLYYDTSNEILHSIGCNCIESWKRNTPIEKVEAEPLVLFSHWKKSTIQSSPIAGSTLSSDLLCLCGTSRQDYNENGSNTDLILAGGVDGRIHIWNSKDMGNNQPLCSWSAHDGLVNCLCFLCHEDQNL